MMNRIQGLALAATILTMGAVGTSPAQAEPASKVFLNGVPAPVYFNDGDSFRVLSGKYTGIKGRLAGFNTLETFGPVHQWGTWTFKEMFVLAKMGTLNARDGVWHCESDMSTDTYGRTLWWCEDLAVDQVRKGLAHAMSITADPARPELVAAQQEAIAAKRGLWAHGVPEWVLTSLHSATENPDREWHYNRLVSSADGRSAKWRHKATYDECSNICDTGTPTYAQIMAAVAALNADETVAVFLGDYGAEDTMEMVTRTARGNGLGPILKDEAHGTAILAVLTPLKEGGQLTRTDALNACHLYVDFKRRFGGGKAECLK